MIGLVLEAKDSLHESLNPELLASVSQVYPAFIFPWLVVVGAEAERIEQVFTAVEVIFAHFMGVLLKQILKFRVVTAKSGQAHRLAGVVDMGFDALGLDDHLSERAIEAAAHDGVVEIR